LSVVAEYAINGRPSDLAVHGKNVLVTDSKRSVLTAFRIDRKSASVLWELPVPPHPVSVRVSQDGRWCSVCSLWPRKLVIVQLPQPLEKSKSPQITASIDLPFAPREQLHLPDRTRLVVADAFGGRLAVVSIDSGSVEAVHMLPANNIRGLVLSPKADRLFVAHQILNEAAPPRASDIIWGVMITNGIRMIQLKKLLDPRADVMSGSRFIPLGDGSRGAGDPDSLIVDENGRIIIALAGIDEVAIVEKDGFSLQRVPVGKRPVSVLGVGKNRFLVANEMSNSLSLIDLSPDAANKEQSIASKKNEDQTYAAPTTYSVNREGNRDADVNVRQLSLGPVPQSTSADRGESLFFNATLSHGNWFSCHSCHTDGHSNGGLADTFGDGYEGAPKRVLSLLGVAETGPWAWKGNIAKLRLQVHQSVQSTMQGKKLSERQASDLVEFLKTLPPPPRFQPANSKQDAAVVEHGKKLFAALDCNACHAGDRFTSNGVFDVGLTDEVGTKKFNPPSLLGVGHRDGLFHDKRAKSIDEVVIRFRHNLTRKLSREEQRALIRYLKSL
jgi:cytochrome c peroxidase